MRTVEQIIHLRGCTSDKIRIFDGGKEVFRGFLFCLTDYDERYEDVKKREVKKQSFHLDISHKEWKERGLLPPLEPEQTARYKFRDLQLELYIDIYI